MSDDFYYKMHTVEEVDRNFARLLAYIEDRPFNEESEEKECFTWSNEEAKEWFLAIGCSTNDKVSAFYTIVDGQYIKDLCYMKIKEPDAFMRFAKEELGFWNARDLLKFNNSIVRML